MSLFFSNIVAGAALAGSIAFVAGVVLAHGDVAPQGVDTSGLPSLEGEEHYVNPYRDTDAYETAIKIGDKLPEATFYTVNEEGPVAVSTADFFAGKKTVIVALPGAFTPTCHNNHLPGFVESAEAIKAKGVDTIAVLAANDAFVMDAWLGMSGAEGKIVPLSDPDAAFADAIGLGIDMSARGLGMRAQRFTMIVEDGVVTALNAGDHPGQVVESSAEKILETL